MQRNDAVMWFDRAGLREIDRRAVEKYCLPIPVLMENAGRAVADAALKLLKPKAGVLVVAGAGNNGGDGLVAARHLHNAGVSVQILLAAAAERFKDAAAGQLKIVEAMKIPTRPISADHAELRDWVVDGDPHDLVIDAIFGTGLARPVTGLSYDVIQLLNTSRRVVLAVDIPSGLDCDTGELLGIAVRAAHTVALCGPKIGFQHAAAYTGKWSVGDIGVPVDLLREYARRS